ncbi:MAG: ABC transporter ATP-binding protein [Gammaproteobacteria bacterium]|jgi:ABC-2 type transport system ATP-binding protein|nr:ABC transporter ATP-binding protein [Gammaproteobacteria bacterium]MBU2428885.1 ABC transporter ATP-binding protein [Gammaproteobacteria bacterium]
MSTIIQAQQLSKSFGRHQVLKELNFTIEAGEPIALIGPNGAGKTTLFSILCGFLAQDAGSIEIFGQKPGSDALSGKVSALPQDAMLDPNFSIGTQLTFYGQLQGMNKTTAIAETKRVLALVDLADYFSQKATVLSHGMRKRVAIAQALLGQPELVLLDEPTAGLDPVNALQVRQIIANLTSEATFMISSHNIFELERLCGTVLYLEHGKLVQQRSLQQGAVGYLNLQLENADAAQVLAVLRQLPGVHSVDNVQKNEFALHFDRELAPELDITLLGVLRAQGWQYRSLTQGRTLEQQLFAVANG